MAGTPAAAGHQCRITRPGPGCANAPTTYTARPHAAQAHLTSGDTVWSAVLEPSTECATVGTHEHRRLRTLRRRPARRRQRRHGTRQRPQDDRHRQAVAARVLQSGHYAAVLEVAPNLGIAVGTDGVGSKLILAEQTGRYDTVGIDCVAMNVNDVVCVGAEPIALLDYLAVERPDPAVMEQIGQGLKTRRRARRRRDPRRRGRDPPRDHPRPPLAERVRPHRHLLRHGRARPDHHRRQDPARRRADRPAEQRPALELVQPRPPRRRGPAARQRARRPAARSPR